MIFFLRTVILISLTLFLSPATALANWTLNLGYHNPPGATVGINFLYWGSGDLMFELGIGWIDVDSIDRDEEDEESNGNATNSSSNTEEDKDSLRIALAGGVNLKYLLSKGGIKPYLQIGAGAGTYLQAGDDNDLGAGIGGLYGGIGILLGNPGFYAYGSYNLHNSESTFVQAGIGFDL